jgi:hypothetical protein
MESIYKSNENGKVEGLGVQTKCSKLKSEGAQAL